VRRTCTSAPAGRIDSNVFFAVSRRRTESDNGLPAGVFDGVIQASVDPIPLSAGLAAIGGEHDIAALLRVDGALLARSFGLAFPPPQIASSSPLRAAASVGEVSGTYIGRSLGLQPGERAGEARLVAFRRAGDLPIYATMARPTGTIIARWRETVLLQLALGLPAWVALVGYALLLRRGQHELAAVNAGLEQRIEARTAELQNSEANARNALAQLDAVYATAPVGLCVFDLQGRYLRVNAELAEMNGVPAEAHIGRTIRELVPDIADASEALLRQVIRSGEPLLGIEIEGERAPQPGVRRAWVEDWSPLQDESGRLVGVNVVTREVTEERATARALVQGEARLRESATRLSTLVDALPLGVGLSDTQGRLLVANAAIRRFVADVVPSMDEARRGRWRSCRPDGSLVDHSDFPVPRALRGETVLPGMEFIYTEDDGSETWARIIAVPLRDGGVTGAVLIVDDITEQKASEEHQKLLSREVDHRAKNALAVVQAALRLTPKDDPHAYAHAIEGRIAALARAHTILAAGQWESAALRELAEAELATFQPDGAGGADMALSKKRVTVKGPDIALASDAVQALSMALHELATNAAKYGALSAPEGRVWLTWQVDRGSDRLKIVWRERGGPRVAGPPTRRGFGSRVIEATVGNQLGGSVERAWDNDGLLCIMTLPIARTLAHGAKTAA
jgi:PAS domain S-box-containing protein